MLPRLRIIGAALLAGLATAPQLIAQGPATTEGAQILVLGTYHFANPGLDMVKGEIADVLSATKQAEIQAVVQALARFRPTKVAVEAVPASAPRLDSLYRAYRAGNHELTRNEIQQLGFRLAGMFDHPQVYPIDHRGDFPFGEVMEYAQQHDSAFVRFVNQEIARITAESNRQQKENTIGEILRSSNEPETLTQGHGIYLRSAGVGAGDTYVGAELLSKWYDRNIHIFANIERITEPGDRILVIVGSGHAPILRELIRHHPLLKLQDALEYLPSR